MLYRSAMFQFPVERGIEWSSLTCHAVLLLGKVDSEPYTVEYVTSYEMLAFAAVLCNEACDVHYFAEWGAGRG